MLFSSGKRRRIVDITLLLLLLIVILCFSFQITLSEPSRHLPIIHIISENILDLVAGENTEFKAKYTWAGREVDLPDGIIELQGASTLNYPKKNYNIRFSNKVLFNPSWGAHKKYTLKANWVDYSQSRNIVSGRIFGQIVKSREKGDLLEISPMGGVVDGFPVEIYINEQFFGMYTLNIPKSKWMFAMTGTGHEAILNAKLLRSASCKLEEEVSTDFSNGWQMKYCSTEEQEGTEWVVDSFNEMIRFLKTSSDEEFIQNINNYTEIDRVIDAMIYTIFIGGYDVFVHNINWITYNGKQWIPSPYDMEVTWGFFLDDMNDPIVIRITPREMLFNELDEILLNADDGTIKRMKDYCYGNLLYRRTYENFQGEIVSRYFELRNGILSEENIKKEFIQFFKGINTQYYLIEKELWPEVAFHDTNNKESIMEYIEQRGTCLDYYFELLR